MVGTIVCGIDASGAAAPVADVARSLADGLGARLVLVHVVEEPAKEAEELIAAIRGRVRVTADADVRLVEGSPAERLLEAGGQEVTGIAVTHVVEPGRPWEVLEAVAERESGRLLVVAARGQSAVRATLLGSVAGQLAASAKRPVVVLPEPAEAGA